VYTVVLGLHNLVRWIVIFAGVWAVALAWRGSLKRLAWGTRETTAARAFVGALDLQFLLGLLLYAVLSPLTRQAFRGVGAAMRDAPVRYFFVEHVAVMLLAIVLAHVGQAKVKRATTDAARFQAAALWLGISLAMIVGFVPWARPLLPSL
jgi:hypothetical protein